MKVLVSHEITVRNWSKSKSTKDNYLELGKQLANLDKIPKTATIRSDHSEYGNDCTFTIEWEQEI